MNNRPPEPPKRPKPVVIREGVEPLDFDSILIGFLIGVFATISTLAFIGVVR